MSQMLVLRRLEYYEDSIGGRELSGQPLRAAILIQG